MSNSIAPASSYRTPFDFSVGGAISQNSTQIAQLRDRYGREARALEAQARMAQAMQEVEKDRYLSSLQALRDRAVRAEMKKERADQHRADQKRRENLRTQAIHMPIASPNLLPFSAHFQRIPAPLPATLKSTRSSQPGATTARNPRALGRTRTTLQQTWLSAGGRRTGGARTQRGTAEEKGDEFVVDADDLLPREPLQPSPPALPAGVHPSTYTQYHTSYPLYASASNSSGSSFAVQPFPPSASAHSSHPCHATSQEPVRHNYGIRHSSLKEVDPPLQTFNVVPPDTGLPLPFSEQDLFRLGHRHAQHPFFEEDVRLVNQEDQEYMKLLQARYPKDHLLPPDSSTTAPEAKLPKGYNLNGWSVKWGQVPKCKETKTMDFLIRKRYL